MSTFVKMKSTCGETVVSLKHCQDFISVKYEGFLMFDVNKTFACRLAGTLSVTYFQEDFRLLTTSRWLISLRGRNGEQSTAC